MPSNLAERLLTDALALPDAERAALAAALIDSLDQSVDENAESAWSAEIAQRLQEIESGAVQCVVWPEARQMILANERPNV